MSRNGKIAPLPRAIRDQLNQRLDDGQEAKDLAAWLNSLPEVQAVLAAYFSEQCAGATVAGLPTRGPIKPN